MPTIIEIAEEMRATEEVLTSVHAMFHAELWLPTAQQLRDFVYPYSFRLPPTGGAQDYSSGEHWQGGVNAKRGVQRVMHEMSVAILVGPESADLSAMIDLASRFEAPLRGAYLGNYMLGGLVENTEVGLYRMDFFPFRDTIHFGILFPVTVYLRERNRVSGRR